MPRAGPPGTGWHLQQIPGSYPPRRGHRRAFADTRKVFPGLLLRTPAGCLAGRQPCTGALPTHPARPAPAHRQIRPLYVPSQSQAVTSKAAKGQSTSGARRGGQEDTKWKTKALQENNQRGRKRSQFGSITGGGSSGAWRVPIRHMSAGQLFRQNLPCHKGAGAPRATTPAPCPLQKPRSCHCAPTGSPEAEGRGAPLTGTGQAQARPTVSRAEGPAEQGRRDVRSRASPESVGRAPDAGGAEKHPASSSPALRSCPPGGLTGDRAVGPGADVPTRRPHPGATAGVRATGGGLGCHPGSPCARPGRGERGPHAPESAGGGSG